MALIFRDNGQAYQVEVGLWLPLQDLIEIAAREPMYQSVYHYRNKPFLGPSRRQARGGGAERTVTTTAPGTSSPAWISCERGVLRRLNALQADSGFGIRFVETPVRSLTCLTRHLQQGSRFIESAAVTARSIASALYAVLPPV